MGIWGFYDEAIQMEKFINETSNKVDYHGLIYNGKKIQKNFC